MAAKKTISISRHKISDKKWENHFFLEIWLIIEDCKYNYTAEIKFEKSYSVALLWGKLILNSALKMLIYANKQNLRMVDAIFFFFFFFCHRNKSKIKLDKVGEGLRPITLRFCANARKLILGSIGTPLDHLSVKLINSKKIIIIWTKWKNSRFKVLFLNLKQFYECQL